MAGDKGRLSDIKYLIAFIYQASKYGSIYIAVSGIAVLAYYFVGKPPGAHFASIIASYLAVSAFGMAFICLFSLAIYDFLEKRRLPYVFSGATPKPRHSPQKGKKED